MTSYTPKAIVLELDRYIISQHDAKKAVAIALRNRWRRQQLPEDLREEVLPKNIIMIGPTGVGKTEISRRLAKLAGAPFIKVEATKFTEVGYVGRDVEQIIRDLVEIAINQNKIKHREEVQAQAEIKAEERILNVVVGDSASDETRQKFRKKFREGKMDEHDIEIEVTESSASGMPSFEIPGMPGAQMGMLSLGDIFGKGFGDKKKKQKLKIRDAYRALLNEESDKLVDQEKVVKEAIKNVEQNGIVFLDEIDKICAKSGNRGGSDISREGVQRDLLPLVEGTLVSTKHGILRTDHILFIASGAFHLTKPSDLLPELQGRLPIRVELNALTKEDFVKILTEPAASLIKQYIALMATEGVTISFTADAIDKIAEIAVEINKNVENIGARRLQTVMEKMLEDISYEANDNDGKKIKIDQKYVMEKVGQLVVNIDLSKFIL